MGEPHTYWGQVPTSIGKRLSKNLPFPQLLLQKPLLQQSRWAKLNSFIFGDFGTVLIRNGILISLPFHESVESWSQDKNVFADSV